MEKFWISSKLDNADEQAATIRRELDIRMKQADNIQKVSWKNANSDKSL